MNKTVKIVIAVAVVAAIAYGAYRWYTAKQKTAKVVNLNGDKPAEKAA